ncbi:aldo/keto reductase [Halioxenophilus sp. WMMB6]|uniref:aldo/keto reductase n=1 Tax=Halioxenophilus sp. WMMB6 TaxID=3073815 RepID=UPI00295F0720|nr:aldo/keto reductase [Halioxenophilus sp. WMMB6]
MQQRRLGNSGIVVSDICMGTMTFGSQADERASQAILDKAFDAGIDFYDTAEMYPVPPAAKWIGRTEEIVGKWLKGKNRDAIILASKVAGPGHAWIKPPLRGGKTALDRHHIMRAIEGSLTRLRTDYIDLYQTHWPDGVMPYEETLRALDDLVRDGKVRIVGCSNETAWGLTKSLGQSELHGLVRYETIQNNFSLNNRRFEDALAQVCRQEQVSLIPYSPIAGGVLSGKYNNVSEGKGRFFEYLSNGPRQQAMAQRFVNEKSLASTARFMAIAEEIELSPVTLAVAWSKQHDFVASTIVGATHVDQMDAILAAAEVTLSAETLAKIDAVSQEIMYPMG